MTRRLGVFLSFPFLASALWAQSFRETVVVTAAGEEEQLEQVPAAVTVVDETELKRSLEASLASVLRRAPGVTVLRSGGDGMVTSLFSRGTNSTHTLVLFEGIRLNDPYFGGYDWSLPLTSGVGKVEILRGPFAALYGSEALGGVIQLFAPRPRGQSWQLAAEAGSSGWQRFAGQASFAGARWDGFVSAVQREGSGTLANDDFWGKAMTFSVGFAPVPGARIGVLARGSRSHTEIPFAGSRTTPHRFTAAEETLVGVPLRFSLGKSLALQASLARVEGTLVFRDPDDPWGYTAADTAKVSWQARAVLAGAFGAHRLQLGGEWRRDQVTATSSLGAALDHKRQRVAAAFFQDRLQLGAAGELLAGVRYDRAASWEELSPRAVWSKAFGSTRLWVAAGKGFRAPSLGELYYPYSGNPGLQPERSRSVEVGVSQLLSGDLLLQLVPFANRVENLVDFDYATWRFGNVAEARQRGVELSLERRAGSSFSRLAATWLDTEDGQGQPLLRRPRWSGSLTLGGELLWGEGELALVYVGRRPDLDPVSFARVWQGGFLTANLAWRLPLGESLGLTARVENLADRAYQEVRGYPAPGRRVFLGLALGGR